MFIVRNGSKEQRTRLKSISLCNNFLVGNVFSNRSMTHCYTHSSKAFVLTSLEFCTVSPSESSMKNTCASYK